MIGGTVDLSDTVGLGVLTASLDVDEDSGTEAVEAGPEDVVVVEDAVLGAWVVVELGAVVVVVGGEVVVILSVAGDAGVVVGLTTGSKTGGILEPDDPVSSCLLIISLKESSNHVACEKDDRAKKASRVV